MLKQKNEARTRVQEARKIEGDKPRWGECEKQSERTGGRERDRGVGEEREKEGQRKIDRERRGIESENMSHLVPCASRVSKHHKKFTCKMMFESHCAKKIENLKAKETASSHECNPTP